MQQFIPIADALNGFCRSAYVHGSAVDDFATAHDIDVLCVLPHLSAVKIGAIYRQLRSVIIGDKKIALETRTGPVVRKNDGVSKGERVLHVTIHSTDSYSKLSPATRFLYFFGSERLFGDQLLLPDIASDKDALGKAFKRDCEQLISGFKKKSTPYWVWEMSTPPRRLFKYTTLSSPDDVYKWRCYWTNQMKVWVLISISASVTDLLGYKPVEIEKIGKAFLENGSETLGIDRLGHVLSDLERRVLGNKKTCD